MSTEFTPISDASGLGEVRANLDVLAGLFPDAVVDGRVDLDVLRDLLGEDAEPVGTEAFGLRWPGMSAARRLSTLPATGTLLPKPDESVAWDQTTNIVIEGDNLEVLRLLRRGYTNKVDVIYIDPPYNTGNDFVYDDSRISSIAKYEANTGQRDDDGATQVGEASDRAQDRRAGASKHAEWLSMMYPRLLVAHHLLKDTGVLIVAIDDKEHSRLKLLLDRVFGAENFVANIVWQGGRKNDSRYVSVGHDYMLIYAKNESELQARGTRWRESKTGIRAALDAAVDCWIQSGSDETLATQSYRAWLASTDGLTPAVTRFKSIGRDGRLYNADKDLSWPGGGGPTYDVAHPATGKPVTVPSGGWRYTQDRLTGLIAEGLVEFGGDERKIPRGKTYLDELDSQVAESVFTRIRTMAGQSLENLLGDSVFSFPKDVGVLARWISLVTQASPDALVLDFFAGSGSTGHAVMELNAADGGNRQYVLVQLDEPVGACGYATIADLTRKRLRRAGLKVAGNSGRDADSLDLGFRSYHLATSNIRPWDGSTEQLNLIEAVNNLVEGRSTEDLLVEMMLRLGVELTTPVARREVADSPLYNLGGTLYAYFGTEITTVRSNELAKALVAWRAEDPVDSDVTVVVRDTGFVDSSAKLNLAAALKQAGFTTLRSI